MQRLAVKAKESRRHNRGVETPVQEDFAGGMPSAQSIDEDVWRGDVELGWPWA